MPNSFPADHHANVAPLWRRCAAMFYDSFLLLAILFIAAAPVVMLTDNNITGYWLWLFRLYLLSCIVLFYGWFWRHGGQTLGMKTWGIYVHHNQTTLSWWRIILRLSFALLGLMNLSMYSNRARLAYHERISTTRTLRR
ncbi:MAG: RDD family protein [Gammaproteobacteria bacterium]|nr:RDD family protein [Gammaproteobacteria bacterium]